MSAKAFRDLLEAGDFKALRRAWAQVAPHLPQPKDNREAELVMHRARSEAETVAFKHRAYSHRWLTERNLPSGLPDKFRPAAERMYPRVVSAVGISCKSRNPLLQPAMDLVRTAMEQAVQDAYAHGKTDPVFVKARMGEARAKETTRLLGAIGRVLVPVG